MQNLFVASQQLLLVLLGRIRLLRLMETLSQLLNRRRRRRRFHPYWTFPRPVESWFEIHMYQRNFPEAFFRRHLRMGRDSFDNLLTLLRGYVQRENTRFRDCIPPEKVLAIGLYRIAHGGSYDNRALAMNVGKTTVHEAFRDVVNALYDIRNDLIKLPVTVDETVPWSQRFFLISLRERDQEEAAKRRQRVAKATRRDRKTSGYLDLESHFHADDRVRI